MLPVSTFGNESFKIGSLLSALPITVTFKFTSSVELSGYVTNIVASFSPDVAVSGLAFSFHSILVPSGNLFTSPELGVFFINSTALGVPPVSTLGNESFKVGSLLSLAAFSLSLSLTRAGATALSYIAKL